MSPDPASGEPRPPDPRELEAARLAVAAPAGFLIANGLLGLVVLGLLSVPLVFDPDMMVESFKKAAAQQPPGPERQELEQKIAEFEAQLNADRDAFVRQNTLLLVAGAGLNLLAIVGGFGMQRFSRYGLSMAAAVASVVPLATGCCVTGIPFGVWTLIVLNRPDVKAAFVARKNAPPPDPDAAYMR
jgi:hypothetical protein